MTVLLITVLVICALALPMAIFFAFDWVREWLHARDVVRRSAYEQRLRAMRAAQQLAQLSRVAHAQLRDLAQEQQTARPMNIYHVTATKKPKS